MGKLIQKSILKSGYVDCKPVINVLLNKKNFCVKITLIVKNNASQINLLR